MKNKHFFTLTLFVISTLLAVFFTWPVNKAYFIACDVGQGDAILLTKGSTQVLIDGGPNDKVLECLSDNMPFWDRKIELLINTHPDNDHLNGLNSIVAQYQVEQLVINSFWQDTDLFARFVNLVREKEILVYSPQTGDKIKLNDFKFQVLWPEKALGDISIWQNDQSMVQAKSKAQILGAKTIKSNEESIVLLLEYKAKKVLLTGDISIPTEKKILKMNNLGKVDLLKMAHHGSKYSSGEKWLEVVKPALAVISVGKNPWGHPTKEVLERLEKVGARILRTDQDKVKILLE